MGERGEIEPFHPISFRWEGSSRWRARSELDHVAERIWRLEQAIDDAVKTAPEVLRAVIDGLQALRGVAKLTATTLAVEVGNF